MKYAALFILAFAMCSCASQKKFVYFQHEGDRAEAVMEKEVPEIRLLPNDILAITVSSVNAAASGPYNLVRPDINSATQPITDFLINARGMINYPGLGEINVEGLTTAEAEEKIKKLVSPFLSDAVVNVRLINFTVTVTGEVRSPSSYVIADQRITLIEALSLAGDINDLGDREKVMVIRESKGEREFMTVNLLTDSVFISPYYYLQQNDVIYVPPTKGKAFSARSEPLSRVILPAVGVLASLASLIIIANR